MQKRFVILFLSLFAAIFSLQAQSYSPETVPNPKQSHNGFVSDPNNNLTTDIVLQLESLSQQVADSVGVEMAYAVLGSIGNRVPKDFATELFNLWGVGAKGADNGLLVLLVLDQRRVEFETGYGIEPILPDALCFIIQQETMLPHFKKGNYGQGLAEAALELRDIFLSNEPFVPAPELTQNKGSMLIFSIYLGALLVALLIFALMYFRALHIADLHRRYHYIGSFTNLAWPIFFPLPFIFIRIFVRNSRTKWRNTTRYSPTAGLPMRKLSETEDDLYLKKGEVVEERIGSVDYDVWLSDENGELMILSYKNKYTQYSACPKCGFFTYSVVQTQITVPPTRHSTGIAHNFFRCKHCKESHTVTIIIPRIPEESHSSASSSGSSTRSGGGSFGGGRSGGGGSGSSW